MRDKEMETVFLGPGSRLPQWVERIEQEAFGDAWTELGNLEQIWALPEVAYAQWSVIPGVEAELLRIVVAKSHQGQGLGKALLAQCQEKLRQEGVQSLHLEVRVSNRTARKLYESLGWREAGHRRAYYKDGEDAALYTLDFWVE